MRPLSFAAAPSAIDPFAISDYTSAVGGLFSSYSSTSGRTSVSVGTPDANTGVFIVAGQSIAGNHSGNLHSPTSTAVQNINPFTGVIYQMKNEMLGASGSGMGCFIPYLGDLLITAGRFNRVIFTTPAVGGTTAHNWSPSGQMHHRLIASIRRCRALGLPISGILWALGESDNQLGTSQAEYQARLLAIIAGSRGAGYTGPWFIAKESLLSNTVSSTIVAAQTAVVAPASGIYAGPNIDSLTGGGNRADGTHFTDAGNAAAAALWEAVLTPHYA